MLSVWMFLDIGKGEVLGLSVQAVCAFNRICSFSVPLLVM
jgi:hypothetical protein